MTDAATVALNCVELIEPRAGEKQNLVGIKIFLRYVPNYNIHRCTRCCCCSRCRCRRRRQSMCFGSRTSGELPSLPSLLPTSKSAHDKQYIDKRKDEAKKKQQDNDGTHHQSLLREPKSHTHSCADTQSTAIAATTTTAAAAMLDSAKTSKQINGSSYIVKEHTSKGKYSEHQLSLSFAR